MFRTACDNSVTTSAASQPAHPQQTRPCRNARRHNRFAPNQTGPTPLHSPTTARQQLIANRHPSARPNPFGTARSTPHTRDARICRRPHSVPRARHGPPARSRNIPMPADDGDQDRVIVVVRPGQPSAGLASHRLNVNPPGTFNHIETEPSRHSNRGDCLNNGGSGLGLTRRA